jgi:hypothetical protein
MVMAYSIYKIILEVQRTDNLHSLVTEMERWRGIIGNEYTTHKRGR